jgi:hypothetical protein
MTDAHAAFQRGIELYKEGDLAAAAVEFRRAYELVPSFKILYNLGQVSYQRHDYAGAMRYFRQYLREGDAEIPAARRREVTADITRLEQRVGRLEVQAVEEGAEVLVDDILVGTTPLVALIPVNSGRRKVDLVARNGEQRTRLVDVAGGEVVRVAFPRVDVPPPVPARGAGEKRPLSVDANPAPPPRPAAAALALPPPAPTAPQPAVTLSAATVPPPAPRSGFPWKAWTLTGLLAGGAATTGVLALLSKRELDAQLALFPSDDVEVDYYSRRTRGFALATDGLLIGTSIMTALSVYLTFRDRR